VNKNHSAQRRKITGLKEAILYGPLPTTTAALRDKTSDPCNRRRAVRPSHPGRASHMGEAPSRSRLAVAQIAKPGQGHPAGPLESRPAGDPQGTTLSAPDGRARRRPDARRGEPRRAPLVGLSNPTRRPPAPSSSP
jgi:hypothetical protein